METTILTSVACIVNIVEVLYIGVKYHVTFDPLQKQ